MSRKSKSRQLSLYLCTWNVGGARPNVDLTDLLDLENACLPDLYCIGLQEVDVVDLSLEEHPWTKTLTRCLTDKGYVRLKVRRMQGVMTVMFAIRSLLSYITSIESEVTKTGFGGWWGNKGGSSIRLDLFGMNLIIVNAHLAAHSENVVQRIVDFDSIIDDQKFRDDDVDNILDHDYVFWMGDLNFRLYDLTYEAALSYIQRKEFRSLLVKDQLIQCKEEKLIFEDFQEGEITFPPTYKFDPGTQMYDTSEKRRVPAWCDRIMWHVYHTSYGSVHLNVKQLHYQSHPSYTISDHKPVTSLVEIQVFGKPPPSPVRFHPFFQAYSAQDLTVTYNISTAAASSDWIGLYKANFRSFHDYVCYIWAVGDAQSEGQRGVAIQFPASKLRVDEGKYCLCYLTKKYSLQGISDEFLVVR